MFRHCCDEVFNGSKRAKHHYQTWHPSLPIVAEGYHKFLCDKCNDFFFIEDELQCHLNLDHGVKTEKNYCKRCNHPYKDLHKCFKDARYAQKKNDHKFQCSQCGKSFTTKLAFRSHVRADHEKRLDFICDRCEKKFGSLD